MSLEILGGGGAAGYGGFDGYTAVSEMEVRENPYLERVRIYDRRSQANQMCYEYIMDARGVAEARQRFQMERMRGSGGYVYANPGQVAYPQYNPQYSVTLGQPQATTEKPKSKPKKKPKEIRHQYLRSILKKRKHEANNNN